MNLFEIPLPSEPPLKARIAENSLLKANQTMRNRINEHKSSFIDFWDSPVSPDEILEEMGTNAAKWVAAASESAGHIARLAAITNQTLDDVLPPEFYVPRRAFIIHENGTVTLEN